MSSVQRPGAQGEPPAPSEAFRLGRLPIRGRERLAALRQLRRILAEDFHGAAVLLQLEAGMAEDDVVILLDAHRLWLHNLVDEAHAEADAYVRWAA